MMPLGIVANGRATAAGAQAYAESVMDVSGRRRCVRAEVCRDGLRTRVFEIWNAFPARVEIEPLEGGLPVARRPEAHIALPGLP